MKFREFVMATSNGFYSLLFLIAFLIISLWHTSLVAQTSKFYFLFYEPEWEFSNSVEAIEKLSPFCDFLSETLNKEISPLYLKKERDIDEYLNKPDVLFGIINTSVVLERYDTYGLEPFLLPVKDGETIHKKVLIALATEDEKDFSTLKGKRLSILTTDRYTLEKQLSSINEIDLTKPSHYFGSIEETTSTESAISSVLFKFTEGALVPYTSFESAKKDDPAAKDHLQILSFSFPMTNAPFVYIGERNSPEEKLKIQESLLSLHENERGRILLNNIHVDTFQKTSLEEIINYFALSYDHENNTYFYEVQKGDNLWEIAERYLGSGEKYPILVDLNKIKNPDIIIPGKKLKLPRS